MQLGKCSLQYLALILIKVFITYAPSRVELLACLRTCNIVFSTEDLLELGYFMLTYILAVLACLAYAGKHRRCTVWLTWQLLRR